jgi:hypothetical protein
MLVDVWVVANWPGLERDALELSAPQPPGAFDRDRVLLATPLLYSMVAYWKDRRFPPVLFVFALVPYVSPRE